MLEEKTTKRDPTDALAGENKANGRPAAVPDKPYRGWRTALAHYRGHPATLLDRLIHLERY